MFLLGPWSLAWTVRADKVFAQEKIILWYIRHAGERQER